MTETTQLGFTAYLKTDFESALERVKNALKVEGFGVLTEVDVKDTFKKNIDVDFRPYRILGACNPGCHGDRREWEIQVPWLFLMLWQEAI